MSNTLLENFRKTLKKSLEENNGVLGKDESAIIEKIQSKSSVAVINKDNFNDNIKENGNLGSIEFKVLIDEEDSKDFVLVFGDINEELLLEDLRKSILYAYNHEVELDEFTGAIKASINIGRDKKIRIQEKFLLSPVEWMSGVTPFYSDIIDENLMIDKF
jgi:hypothetical protein